MKKITLILFTALSIVSCKKTISNETIVEGIIRTEEGEALPDTKVGVFGMSNDDAYNGYQLLQETTSDENGLFYMVLDERSDLITATKSGYFDLTARDKEITNGRRNIFEIEMNKGCKVNFTLLNPDDYDHVCLSFPWAVQWEYYNSECFEDVDTLLTSCYLVGGDTAEFKISYHHDTYYSSHYSRFLYCPKGGEIDYTITY